jgi:putative membrane protein insertion efficiency factor
MLELITRAVSRSALSAIRFYQRYLSPLLPPSCRFQPTCSQYTYQAIERFGIWRGGWLGVRRLCRCNPFYPCGCDMVPEYWGQAVPFLPDRPVSRKKSRRTAKEPEAGDEQIPG